MQFVGQLTNKEFIRQRQSLPNSTVILGEHLSGKHTFAKYMAQELGYDCIFLDNKIDSIREMIYETSNFSRPTMVVISVKDMSVSAKNSLLKITEEPPTNVRLCLVANSEQELLNTLISRSWVISMLPYTRDQLIGYLKLNNIDSKEPAKIFNSPGQIKWVLDNLGTQGLDLYLEKVQFFCDNILQVSPSNALKVADWFKFKDTDKREDALDLTMFLGCVLNQLSYNGVSGQVDDLTSHFALVLCVSGCLQKVQKKGSNPLFAVNEMLTEVTSIG